VLPRVGRCRGVLCCYRWHHHHAASPSWGGIYSSSSTTPLHHSHYNLLANTMFYTIYFFLWSNISLFLDLSDYLFMAMVI
jgi:hypothetical protein